MAASPERAEQIRKRHTSLQNNPTDRQWQRDLKFHNDGDDRFWRIRAYNVETGEMIEPYVEWRLPDGSHRPLAAEPGVRSNSVWDFFNLRASPPHPSPDSPKSLVQTNFLAAPEFSPTPL